MSILIDLVKLGAIGASLAFFILSFWLLWAERALKDREGNPLPPRKEILRDIRRLRGSALVFLVVGVFSEFFLSNGVEIMAAIYQLGFKNDLVRVRFNDWEYDPARQLVGFGFEEDRTDTANFILPSLQNQYDVYIGIRPKTATPAAHGEYKLVFGPFPVANQARLDQTLTPDQLALLGNNCVELTAFGVARMNAKPTSITQPFNPDKLTSAVTEFNSAGVCP